MVQNTYLTHNQLGKRLEQIYTCYFKSNSSYTRDVEYFGGHLLMYFKSSNDLLISNDNKADMFAYLAGDLLFKKAKLHKLICITQGWTLLSFDMEMKGLIHSLKNSKSKELVAVKDSDKLILQEIFSSPKWTIQAASDTCS